MINLKKEYLEELTGIFKEYCPKAEIWAYGSRVKNTSHSGSDLDLVVKSFNEKDKFVWELDEIINNSDLPFLVDLHQFDKLPESFQNEIEKDYVKIFFNGERGRINNTSSNTSSKNLLGVKNKWETLLEAKEKTIGKNQARIR